MRANNILSDMLKRTQSRLLVDNCILNVGVYMHQVIIVL